MALSRCIGSVAAACVLAACASAPHDRASPQAEPSAEELIALVRAELTAKPVFLAAPAGDEAARKLAAQFESELAFVHKRGCVTRDAGGLTCAFETVLRFPALAGRESRQLWERDLKRVEQRWVMVQTR